jgi:hypothetical protein
MVALALSVAAALAYAFYRVAVGYPNPRGEYRSLTRADAAFLESVANAMYPPGGPIEASGGEADLPAYMDRLLCASARNIRVLMHLLFFLMEHATLFFPASGWSGMRRFSALSEAQQVAALDGWQNSALFLRRLVFTSMRALVTLGYFAHPPVVRALNLAPFAIESPVCEADLLYPRIGQRADSIEFSRADLSAEQLPPLQLNDPLHPAFAESASTEPVS